jgi:hypothetical protein
MDEALDHRDTTKCKLCFFYHIFLQHLWTLLVMYESPPKRWEIGLYTLPNVSTSVITKKCIYIFQVTITIIIIDSFQNVGRTKNPEETAIDIFYVLQVTTIVKADCS